MSFTEQDLSLLNQYAYNVDKGNHVNKNLAIPEKNKEMKMDNGTIVYVVDVKDDDKTGFQGIAVASIVNGKPDYSQVTVVAAATDNSDWNDLKGALQARNDPYGRGSNQTDVAIDFVNQLPKKCTVTQLSGYSQSAYMLKVGANLGIPTTVFNGFFRYMNLSKEEKEFIEANPHLFRNYRHTKDFVTGLADLNTTFGSGNDFGTIIWIEGNSHNIKDWKFDKNGRLIVNGDSQEKRAVKLAQIQNQSALAMYSLLLLRDRLKASGGSLSANEEIYLNNSQALLAVSAASQTMKTGLASVIKLYQDAIVETEQLWTDGLQRARSIGTDLNESEIIEALASAGATEASIVTEPTAFYEKKIAKAKQMGESFDALVSEIQSGIEKLVQSDRDLASQL
ncbi:hypothetical protein [uncultured Enterococcus sp.]|uniref:hypothetical protein n=1 Tax=uncultured Enterococcus sp. TaxID=167972 RepID=UPI002AA651DB|nr:hypothetical protein [uncultured Enterococcus sp.]